MKALATESRRHRGKAFFSSPCLCACVAIFFHGKVFPVLPELRSANKTGFLSAFFKAFVLVAPGLKLGMCCDGKQCDSAFCDHLEGGRRKKQTGVEPQRHQGTKEAFFVCPRSSGKPKKTLCLRAFVVPFFSKPFVTPSKSGIHCSPHIPDFEGVHKGISPCLRMFAGLRSEWTPHICA